MAGASEPRRVERTVRVEADSAVSRTSAWTKCALRVRTSSREQWREMLDPRPRILDGDTSGLFEPRNGGNPSFRSSGARSRSRRRCAQLTIIARVEWIEMVSRSRKGLACLLHDSTARTFGQWSMSVARSLRRSASMPALPKAHGSTPNIRRQRPADELSIDVRDDATWPWWRARARGARQVRRRHADRLRGPRHRRLFLATLAANREAPRLGRRRDDAAPGVAPGGPPRLRLDRARARSTWARIGERRARPR